MYVHRRIAPPKTLLLVVLLLVGSSQCHYDAVEVAYASNLPATIVGGSYTSSYDTVPLDGTTLDVVAMLTDAAMRSLPAAFANFYYPTFLGTLYIVLPVTENEWAIGNNNNIINPLHVLIEDGISSGTPQSPPTVFISIRGLLAYNSNITVHRGTYAFTNSFMYIPSSSELTGTSTLAVIGGTFRAHHLPTNGGTHTAVIMIDNTTTNSSSSHLSISGRSTLIISNNSITANDLIKDADWYFNVVDVSYSLLSVSNASTMIVDGNSMLVSNVALNGTFSWNVLCANYFSLVNITQTSRISIANNQMHCTGTTIYNPLVANYWYWSVMSFSSSAALRVSASSPVDGGGAVTVSNNHMTATEVVVGSWYWNVIIVSYVSRADLDGNSTLSISNNIMSCSNTRVVNAWYWSAYFVAYNTFLTLSDNSSMELSNSVMDVRNATNGGNWFWSVYFFGYTNGIDVSKSSSLSLIRNAMLSNDVNASAMYWNAIFMGYTNTLTLNESSRISSTDNKMEMTNFLATNTIFWCDVFLGSNAFSYLSDMSSIAISNSTMLVSNVQLHSGYWSSIMISYTALMSVSNSNSEGSLPASLSPVSSSSSLPPHIDISTSNITMTLVNSTVSNLFYCTAFFVGFASTLVLEESGVVAIQDATITMNTFLVTTTNPLYCSLFYLANAGNLQNYNNSLLAALNNKMKFTNIKVRDFYVNVLYLSSGSSFRVQDVSSVIVRNTAMGVFDVEVAGTLFWAIHIFLSGSPVAVSNSSTYSTTNTNMTANNAHVATGILYCNVILTIYNNGIIFSNFSNLIISETVVSASAITAGGELYWCTMFLQDSLSLNSKSSIDISYNTIFVRNATMVENGYWSLFNSVAPSSGVTLSESSININNNHAELTNMTVGGYWYVLTTYGLYYSISLSESSIFSIYSNDVVISNIVVTGGCWCYSIGSYYNVPSLTTGSAIIVSNNTMTVSHLIIRGGFEWYLLALTSGSKITFITSDSSVTVSGNVLIAMNMSVGGGDGWRWSVLFLAAGSVLNISPFSTLLISNNNVELKGDNVSPPLTGTVQYPTTVATVLTSSVVGTSVRVFGDMIVAGNTITIPDNMDDSPSPSSSIIVVGIFQCGAALLGLGRLQVYHNSIWSGRSSSNTTYILYAGTISLQYPAIIACANYVNGTMCLVNNEGNYTCATTSNLGGKVLQCPSSATISKTLSRSILATRSKTNTISHIATVSPSLAMTKSTSLNQTRSPHPTTSTTTSSTPSFNLLHSLSLTIIISKSSSLLAPANNTTNTTTTQCPTPLRSGGLVCPFADNIALGNITTEDNTMSTTTTSSVGNVSTTTTALLCLDGGQGLTVSVPHVQWIGNTPFYVSIRLRAALMLYYNSESSSSFSEFTIDGALKHRSVLTTRRGTAIIPQQLWIVAEVKHEGSTTSSSNTLPASQFSTASPITVVIHLPIPTRHFNCSFIAGSGSLSTSTIPPSYSIPVNVILEAAPLDESVVIMGAVVEAVVVVAVVISALPSSIVRAGMMDGVINMLQCADFDPTDDVGIINNPFGWAAGGREELQYHRGSVFTGLIGICIALVCTLCILTLVRFCSTTAASWSDVVHTLRLPSLPLVIVLILSEVCVASATSMLFYADSDVSDRVVALVVMGLLFGYMAVYVFCTAISARYIEVVDALPPTRNGGVTRQANTSPAGSIVGRLFRYALEPTHDIILSTKPIKTTTRRRNNNNNDLEDDDNHTTNNKAIKEGWLRRNFYFVAERRWAAYGSLEVVGGTIINMLEGIPLATANRSLCIARPACVMIIATILSALLVWKTPNAVRLQQWCSLFVVGGMLLTSALATGNAVSPSQSVVRAAMYMGTATVSVSLLLSLIEMTVMLITYFPQIRTALSLRSRTLQSTIQRSRKREVNEVNVPMLVVPPPLPIITATTTNTSSTSLPTSGHDSTCTVPPATPPTQQYQPPLQSNNISTPTTYPTADSNPDSSVVQCCKALRGRSKADGPHTSPRSDGSDDPPPEPAISAEEEEVMRQILADLELYEAKIGIASKREQ